MTLNEYIEKEKDKHKGFFGPRLDFVYAKDIAFKVPETNSAAFYEILPSFWGFIFGRILFLFFLSFGLFGWFSFFLVVYSGVLIPLSIIFF